MGPGFESLREHKTNAGLSQYIGDCSCSVQVGLTPSESIQLETMYMSNGQIWVGSIPPMAQSSLNLLYIRWVFWARMFQGWRNSLARRSWRVRFPSGPQNRWSCHRHISLFYKFRRWCIHTDLSAYESVGDKQKWKPHSGLSWSANRFFLLEWRSAETQNSLEGNPEELGSIPRYATKSLGR